MNDLPPGPHRSSESGVRGRSVDEEPAPEASTGEDRPDPDTPAPRPAREGFMDGGDEPPMSEHHRWGDTAYGRAVE